jgi:hypothetical protein
MNYYSRVTVQGLSIGDNLAKDKFDVLEDYKELDFPYKEAVLKNDSNIILGIIGEDNTIFEIVKINLSDKERKVLINSITKRIGVEPDSSINVFTANIWYCNMYIWSDLQSYDIIELSSCVHKNNILNLGEKWELKIYNDTIRNLLDEKYNQFH